MKTSHPLSSSLEFRIVMAKDVGGAVDVLHEESVEKLKNCADRALDSEDWPEVCDKVKNSTFE